MFQHKHECRLFHSPLPREQRVIYQNSPAPAEQPASQPPPTKDSEDTIAQERRKIVGALRADPVDKAGLKKYIELYLERDTKLDQEEVQKLAQAIETELRKSGNDIRIPDELKEENAIVSLGIESGFFTHAEYVDAQRKAREAADKGAPPEETQKGTATHPEQPDYEKWEETKLLDTLEENQANQRAILQERHLYYRERRRVPFRMRKQFDDANTKRRSEIGGKLRENTRNYWEMRYAFERKTGLSYVRELRRERGDTMAKETPASREDAKRAVIKDRGTDRILALYHEWTGDYTGEISREEAIRIIDSMQGQGHDEGNNRYYVIDGTPYRREKEAMDPDRRQALTIMKNYLHGGPAAWQELRRQRWREEWDREGIPWRSSDRTSPTQLISGLGLPGREMPGQEGVYDSTDYHSFEQSKKHREGMRGIGPGAYGPATRGRGVLPRGEIPETRGGPATPLGPDDAYGGLRFRPYETRREKQEYLEKQKELVDKYAGRTEEYKDMRARYKALEKHYRNHPQYGQAYREFDALLSRADSDPYDTRTKLRQQVTALEMGASFEHAMETLKERFASIKTKRESFEVPKAISTQWQNLTVTIINKDEPDKPMKYLPGVAERVGDDNTLERLYKNGIHVENNYNIMPRLNGARRVNGVNVRFSKTGKYLVVVSAEEYRKEYEVNVAESEVERPSDEAAPDRSRTA